MALVYNASDDTVKAYLNAETDKWKYKLIFEATNSDYSGHWKIGRYPDGYGLTKVDELLFWDRPLTSQQIKALYGSYGGKHSTFSVKANSTEFSAII